MSGCGIKDSYGLQWHWQDSVHHGQMEIPVLDTQYTDAVDVVCMVPLEKEGSLVAQITEKTGGKAVMTRGKECYYGFADGELVLF